jgi:MFS family permease
MTRSNLPTYIINTAKDDLNSRRMNRRSVSVFFLMHGLTFAAWASRIPTVQATLGVDATQLGVILLCLPLGFFVSLPFSGWIISRFGSRRATIASALLYSCSLVSLGVCSSMQQVMACLFFFGFFANALNLSMNTQAVEVEKMYNRRLLSTFHGLWSLAGFAGAAIGAWCMGMSISLLQHFSFIAAVFMISILIFAPRLAKAAGNEGSKGSFFALPDKSMLIFGAIAFCSAMIEGAMFDWSGIYFKDTVRAEAAFTGLGYTTFMVAMAAGRFCADALSERFKLRRVLVASGTFVTVGLLVAVTYPTVIFAAIGFALIGTGVSSVVPLVYSTAGRSKTMAAGTALTAVSSLGFVGFLIGPPIIGFVAGMTDLKGSFIALTLMSASVIVLSSFVRDDQ